MSFDSLAWYRIFCSLKQSCLNNNSDMRKNQKHIFNLMVYTEIFTKCLYNSSTFIVTCHIFNCVLSVSDIGIDTFLDFFGKSKAL